MANKEHRPAGGTAWWCPDVMNPVAVYVQGMGYNSTGAQYSVSLLGNTSFCYTAQEADLFDTEKEAQEEYIRRLDKEKEQLKERLQHIERHRSIAMDRIRNLESCDQVKNWSDVTTSAVISGSNTSRNNITVTGNGVLTIKDGAVVSHLTVKDHGTVMIKNAYANDVNVYSSVLNLRGSSIINGASVSSQGEIWIDEGAEGRGIDIQDKGFVWVRSSGCVKYTKIRNGGFLSVRGEHTPAFNTTVSSGGSMSISAKAYIANCSVEPGGELRKDSSCTCENLYVREGGIDK